MKFVLSTLALVGLASSAGALAAEKNWAVDGTALSMTSPCARSVSIEPSSTLSGRVEIEASAEHQEEIDQLAVTGGAKASIATREKGCRGSKAHVSLGPLKVGTSGPTLELIVRVPAGAAIDIKEGGSTDYQIGAVDGTLRLELHGSGSIDAERLEDVVAIMSGSGDVRINTVAGHIDGRLNGSGDLSVTHADSPAAAYTLSGSGSIEMEDGKVGALTVSLTGNGDVSIGAIVGDAELTVRGSGNVALREVTGQVKQSVKGSGRVVLGGH